MIDKDEAIRLLRKEVANKGADHVYEYPSEDSSCFYFYGGRPSCIVGHALASSSESYVNEIGAQKLPAFELFEHFPEISKEASDVFRAAQSKQDYSLPWGEALEAAENTYRRLGGTE